MECSATSLSFSNKYSENFVKMILCRRRLNIDMSNVPPEQEYADKCFVDSLNKEYWIDK